MPDAIITGVSSSASLGLQQLQRQGYVQPSGDSWVLTERGIEAAAQDAHNQQLWEVYRFYGDELQLPLINEDRQRPIADVLPDEAVSRLEDKLNHLQGTRTIATGVAS